MDWWHVGAAIAAIVLGFWCSSRLFSAVAARNGSSPGSRHAAKIPSGGKGWPLIGETLEFIASNYSAAHVNFMRKRRSLYGKVFMSNILGRPIIMSTDAEVNKIILQNDGSAFVPYYPKTVIEVMGATSILQMHGDAHKRLHSIVARFLKSTAVMERMAEDIRNALGAASLSWRSKRRILLQDEINQMSFDILLQALLGIQPGKEMQILRSEFYELVKALICLPIKFPGTRLHKSLKAKERMTKVIEEIIKERVEKGGHQEMQSLVDVAISEYHDAADQSTADFICNLIIEMMIPGQDSVPMIMTLAIKYLSDSPVALKQILDENMELKNKKRQSGDCYSCSDYTSLPFTQNVINEVLRMANIVNAVWRKALKDVEIKGYLIPKGWCVMASFSSIHFDEEIYDNPFEFNPWRWESKVISNQSSFTPFGGGQRLCPGYNLAKLEIAVFLHHFLTTFSWVAEDDSIVTFPRVRMKNRLPVQVMSII